MLVYHLCIWNQCCECKTHPKMFFPSIFIAGTQLQIFFFPSNQRHIKLSVRQIILHFGFQRHFKCERAQVQAEKRRQKFEYIITSKIGMKDCCSSSHVTHSLTPDSLIGSLVWKLLHFLWRWWPLINATLCLYKYFRYLDFYVKSCL